MSASLSRRALAELIGTALLVVAVVGSGITAQRLSPNDVGLQLLENAVATGSALVAIILAIGPVSGAHLNPVITVANAVLHGAKLRDCLVYVASQVAGGAVGAAVANLMFSLPAITLSAKVRGGGGLWLAEVVATFGLVLVVFGVSRGGRQHVAPFAVGAYIMGAYFFTASTSFANPAVTVARMFSNTFAGITPSSVAAFVAAQLVGAILGVGAIRVMHPAAVSADAAGGLPHTQAPS